MEGLEVVEVEEEEVEVSPSYCGVVRMGGWRSALRLSPSRPPAGPSLPWLSR